MIKFFSKIVIEDTVYYSPHAEQCLDMLKEGGGIGAFIIQKASLDDIFADIESDSIHNYFVLDCENVESIQINSCEKKLGELVSISGKKILFANAKESLVSKMSIFHYFEQRNAKYKTDTFYKWFGFGNDNKLDYSLIKTPTDAFQQHFIEKIKKFNISLSEGNIEHHSSSVKLTSYIDIKRFIVEERPFMLFAIYRLAVKMQSHWLKEHNSSNSKPILVCQSLNGSYVASVLSSLLNLDLYILDQVGPINKLYRSLGAKVKVNADYIVVSDMVCLGTEVKIVKNIIEYLGGNYVGNVTVVRTKSVREYDNTEEVFKIDENNREQLNYRIITAIG